MRPKLGILASMALAMASMGASAQSESEIHELRPRAGYGGGSMRNVVTAYRHRDAEPSVTGQRKRRKLIAGNPHLLRSKKYKKFKK